MLVVDKALLSEEFRRETAFGIYVGSGSGPERDYEKLFKDMNDDDIEAFVYESTVANLDCRKADAWLCHDDAIFALFYGYAMLRIARNRPQDAIELWQALQFKLEEVQTILLVSGDRIHIGSPLYNLGLCYLWMGDYDSAYRYLAEAGIEDEKNGTASRIDILIGNHNISGEVLLTPLDMWLESHPGCSETYEQTTKVKLNAQQIRELIAKIATSPESAMLTLSMLHRFTRTFSGLENHATRNVRVRSLAEMVVPLETTIRLNHAGGSGQLNDRMKQLISRFPAVSQAFEAARLEYKAFDSSQTDEVQSMNWLINRALRACENQPYYERIGYGAFMVVKLRNSLLHFIDSSLVLYQDRLLVANVLGVLLGIQWLVFQNTL